MRDRDRTLGAYIGAAIGDAMGGPVEGSHAARIRRLVGEITGFLPYRKPYSFADPHPGYCLHPDAGSVTDDTFIRGDLTRFYLATRHPRTPRMLAQWLLENADFSQWWRPAIEALRRIERGEVAAENGGLVHPQGGGAGWWTPVGIVHAGDPAGAKAEAGSLCRIWKAPLEQDLLSAVQAGVAEGMRGGATFESMVDVMLESCGPLPRRLLERGASIGYEATDLSDLVDRLYRTVLMPEKGRKVEGVPPPTGVDAAMPPLHEPLDDSDEPYASSFHAEQIPLAIAAFVFARGDPCIAIPTACMIGRDADSTATNVGSWVGALHGESGLPRKWVDTVCEVNLGEIDIRGLGEELAVLETRYR